MTNNGTISIMCCVFVTVIYLIILATIAKINYNMMSFFKRINLVTEVYIFQLQRRLTRNLVIYVILQKIKHNFRVQFHNIAVDITLRG